MTAMQDSNLLKTYLVVSGVLLILFGAGTLLVPIELKAVFDIAIPQDINVLNDVRAFSTLSFVIGVLAVVGAFVKRLTYTSSLIVFVQFLALGSGRLVSVLIDGMPVQGNIIGMGNEFFLGIVGAVLFAKYQGASAVSEASAKR